MKVLLHAFKIIGLTGMLFFANPIFAQVGVGTTAPNASSLLDIDDLTGTKGLLIPRVALTATNLSSPISPAPATSLLVYNTNTNGISATRVVPGYYYWNGVKWVNLEEISDKWDTLGNTGTVAATNFLGTIDDIALTFRTKNIERFRVSNGYQVLAMGTGSAAAPFYSWDADKTMGFWKSGTKQLDMVINGTTFFNSNANNGGSQDLEWTFNPGGVDMNLRVETDNNANSFFVNGEDDNIGLGTNTPNKSSQLEMAAINKGLLVNRVSLTATTTAAPVTVPATGLLVYNMVNGGIGSTAVRPGFYYWDGAKWVAMDGTNGKDWSLKGNYGTSAATDFLGTSDATDLVFKTSNTERMRFLSSGNAALLSSPYTNVALRVNGGVQDFGIYSENTNAAGISILGVQYGNGDAVSGQSVGAGAGVYGYNGGTGIGVVGQGTLNFGIFGTTPFQGGALLTAGTVGVGTGANNSNGMIAATVAAATTGLSVGLRAIAGGTTSYSNTAYLNVGVNTNSKQLGLYSLSEGPIKLGGTNFANMESAMFQTNYDGVANDADGKDPFVKLAGYANGLTNPLGGTSNIFYGGYLYSGGNNNGSYAYAASRIGNTNYKILGNGTVSTIVKGASGLGNGKIMFAPEAPEVLFEDYGTGKLVNGKATINIDPIFAENISVTSDRPLKVFIQLEGDCNGVYISDKSVNSFTVKELQGGNSSVAFSWHIVANRKDEMGRNTEDSSMYANLRFPDAPSKIELKAGVKNDLKTAEIKPTRPVLTTQNK